MSDTSSFFYIKYPTTNMRKKPSLCSEVLSQAYYSEEVKILEQQDSWAYIQTPVDSYKGWTPLDSLIKLETSFLPSKSATVTRCSSHVYNKKDTIFGPVITLPFDSRLKVISLEHDSDQRWIQIELINGELAYIQSGDVTLNPKLKKKSELQHFSLQFLNIPYTWGGRSSFGYDCSGFVQMLYRQIGVHLPRDAKEQIYWEGFTPTSLKDLESGDLLFWGNSPDQIYHVGMYLENHRFIHATVAENAPYIRVSYLTDPSWNGSSKWPYLAACSLKKTYPIILGS
jgi:gamma-D-glutamyl-L-lysine dipeptidyl-peptidase